jgi:hypothetical protein
VRLALAQSVVSQALNPAFVARHNGTDRNRKAGKGRKRACFSKDWGVQEAGTSCTMDR